MEQRRRVIGGPGSRAGMLALTLLMALFIRSAPAALSQQSLATNFGPIHLVQSEHPAKGLVLLVTSPGAWDAAADQLAGRIAALDYWVAGLPADALTAQAGPQGTSGCQDPAADLSGLATWIAVRYPLPKGALPILLGADQGAALVFSALRRAPAKTFHAAITLDFCPTGAQGSGDAPTCVDQGPGTAPAADRQPASLKRVQTPWFAIETGRPPACPGDAAHKLVLGVDNARLVAASLSRAEAGQNPVSAVQDQALAGHVEATADQDWLSPTLALLQWLDPRIPNQVQSDAEQSDIGGLPLVEVRADQENPTTFAVMLSGDGGWASLDRAVSDALAAQGVSVVGWDSLGYFWTAHEPDPAAADLVRVLRHYLARWRKERVLLIGYSFGADVLPFLASRLPPDLSERVDLVALLGAGQTATFEFHLSDWLGGGPRSDGLPVREALAQGTWPRLLCIYGDRETDSICPSLSGPRVIVEQVPGDHHFNADYAGLAERILKALGKRPDGG